MYDGLNVEQFARVFSHTEWEDEFQEYLDEMVTRTCCPRPRAAKPRIEEKLGGDDHAVAHIGEGLAHNALVVPALRAREVGAVDLGRVKERAARLVRTANSLNAVALVRDGAIPMAERHAIHTNLGDLDVPQHSLFHTRLFLVSHTLD